MIKGITFQKKKDHLTVLENIRKKFFPAEEKIDLLDMESVSFIPEKDVRYLIFGKNAERAMKLSSSEKLDSVVLPALSELLPKEENREKMLLAAALLEKFNSPRPKELSEMERILKITLSFENESVVINRSSPVELSGDLKLFIDQLSLFRNAKSIEVQIEQ